MGKLKNHIVIIIVLVMLFTVFIKDRIFMLNIELQERELEEIASFYEINSEAIVEGENFDLKYVYRDPNRPISSIKIELVAKNKKSIKMRSISYYDKNGIKLCNTNEINRDFTTINDKMFFETIYPNRYADEYVRSGYMRYAKCALDFYTNDDPEIGKYDLGEISLTIQTRTGIFGMQDHEETYYLMYDEERQFTASKKIKDRFMNGEACNAYEKRQIEYYFGIMFYRDFDKWYTEIKEYLTYLIKINDYKDIDPIDMLNYPYQKKNQKDFDSEFELQNFMNLSDDQYDKYIEVIQIIKDLGIYNDYFIK